MLSFLKIKQILWQRKCQQKIGNLSVKFLRLCHWKTVPTLDDLDFNRGGSPPPPTSNPHNRGNGPMGNANRNGPARNRLLSNLIDVWQALYVGVGQYSAHPVSEKEYVHYGSHSQNKILVRILRKSKLIPAFDIARNPKEIQTDKIL